MADVALRDWAGGLPEEILNLVLLKLIPLQDYIRFSSVCKWWNYAAKEQRHSRIATSQKQVPLLLVPTKTGSRELRSLYSLSNDDLLQSELGILNDRRCCGSSYGWLAFVEEDYRVALFNPFTQSVIYLPPIADYESYIQIIPRDPRRYFQYFAKRLILSADPSLYPNDYVAAALINDPFRTPAIIRPSRDREWRKITKWSNHQGKQGLTFDLIFDESGNWVYASGDYGLVARTNIHVQNPVLELVVKPWIPNYLATYQKYLVETTSDNGTRDMLMILRIYQHHFCYTDMIFTLTKAIKVFKLQNSKFVKVDHLNGNAVFIGDNSSTAVLATKFPDVEENWIYYTDDFVEFSCHYHHKGPCHIGKYNVKDRKFSTHYVPYNRKWPPSIWIFPTLNP